MLGHFNVDRPPGSEAHRPGTPRRRPRPAEGLSHPPFLSNGPIPACQRGGEEGFAHEQAGAQALTANLVETDNYGDHDKRQNGGTGNG